MLINSHCNRLPEVQKIIDNGLPSEKSKQSSAKVCQYIDTIKICLITF